MADFIGTIADDAQDGTDGDDIFDYSQGGNDTLSGLKGNDTFLMGAELTAADTIVGGRSGKTFLIVDANGHAGYQASADYVIELQGALNLDQLSTANFTH